jgi:glycosyltransferase involved in cell wall biosynthesis
MIKYSVIVPAYRAVEVLPCCIAALRAQTTDRADYEIIVVDDGSPDQTAAVAEKSLAAAVRGADNVYAARVSRAGKVPAQAAVPGGAQVIRAAHGGPAHARNLGAQAARGAILAFTDADCEPAPDWLERLTAALGDETVSGAKGAYRTRQTSLVARFVQQEYSDKYDRLAPQAAIDFIDTYSAAYRREVFLKAGGFDEAFTTASVEDQELSFRLAAQGRQLVFVPQALVYHQHDATLLDYARRKYGIGYWKTLILKHHPGKAVRDSHTPQIIKVQLGLLAGALLTTLLTLFNLSWAVAAEACWLLFLISMLPLLGKIARRDPAVLVIAPLMISLRALGLGLGLTRGFLHFATPPNPRA